MQKALLLTFLSALTGCASYTGLVLPADDAVDEGNRPFAKKAAEEYEMRKQFRRPVVIQEAEGMTLFLSPTYVPRSLSPQVNEICRSLEVRRTLAQTAKAQLRQKVSGLRDLQLTGENDAPMVSVGATSEAPASVYRITYNISNLDLQLKVNEFVTVNGRHPAEWTATVSAEVRMISPEGNSVFSFTAQGEVRQSDDGSLRPNVTMLEEAASAAISRAMEQYTYKFDPPIYVTDTCQGGEFVRINVGTDYGLRAGMRVEFFRHRSRQGLDGEAEIAEQRVGTGVVGYGHAPVQNDSAWVHVDDFGSGDSRTVFQWTSARLLREPLRFFDRLKYGVSEF